jgi:phage-related protein
MEILGGVISIIIVISFWAFYHKVMQRVADSIIKFFKELFNK